MDAALCMSLQVITSTTPPTPSNLPRNNLFDEVKQNHRYQENNCNESIFYRKNE
jgi:hypothetical protein